MLKNPKNRKTCKIDIFKSICPHPSPSFDCHYKVNYLDSQKGKILTLYLHLIISKQLVSTLKEKVGCFLQNVIFTEWTARASLVQDSNNNIVEPCWQAGKTLVMQILVDLSSSVENKSWSANYGSPQGFLFSVLFSFKIFPRRRFKCSIF